METLRHLTGNDLLLPVGAILGFGLVLLLAVSAGASPPPDPETLLRVVRVSEPRLGPDGSLVAFTAADRLDPTLTQIWLATTDGASVRPFTAGGRSARAPRWSPDGSALLFLSARADTAREQVQWIALDGGASVPVTREPLGVLDMDWAPDGLRIACLVPVAAPPESGPIVPDAQGSRCRLAVLDGRDGPLRFVSPDDVDAWGFAWSPDGTELAVLTSPPGSFGAWRRGGLALVHADGTGWRALPVAADPTQTVAFSPSGDRIAFFLRSAEDLPYPVLAVTDRSGRDVRRLAPAGDDETDEGVAWPADGTLRTASFRGVRSYLNRVDPETGRRTRIVERGAQPREAARSFSAGVDGAMAWVDEGSDTPGDVMALAPGATEPRRLTRMNPDLGGLDLPVPETVTWRSFDGRRVEGLLFLPPGARRGLPLVVEAHGGPASLWSLGFHGYAEAPALQLARRGYAVLCPNPRGSLGYGEAFFSLNHGDPGGGDLADIEAGVDSLVAAGVADGGRVAIAGFSYGGYLAARAVTLSDRYACALVAAAPANFFTDFTRNELAPHWHREYLGGAPHEIPGVYVERSPLFHVRGVRTPVLIVHGSEDRRVAPGQSRELWSALLSEGKTAELVLYPGEGHGIAKPRNQVDFLNRQIAWFDRWLKPAADGERP